MQTNYSTGYVELRSFSAALIVADAMLKAAHVRVRTMQKPGGGLVCVHVFGDLASCQAAVAAGAALAAASGALLHSVVIGRPAQDTVTLWEEEIPAMKRRKQARAAQKALDTMRDAVPAPLRETSPETGECGGSASASTNGAAKKAERKAKKS